MEVKNTNVALIVHSCDRYEFLYKGFEFFFSKYWDADINCKRYFATEEKNVVVRGFENIHSGKGAWADRLAFLLREKISEPYILYFQEDMWLNKKVNARFFDQIFELTRQKNWLQVKLHSTDVYKTTPTDLFVEGFNISKIDNVKSDFLMSHQVTLWRKDFLLRQLHKNEHPWRNERVGTKRLKKLNPEIHQIDYFAENGRAALNKNNNPILRSEYQTISVNGILNNNVQPYIAALMQEEDEGLRKYAAQLAHNFENRLTHDGKPKPQKTDVFKRFKNWLKGV
jgi:hypothetical protein